MRALAVFVLAALAGAAATAGALQGTRTTGTPEENLPRNTRRLTHFGERASWSPDGARIAFMEKSFGDAYEVDVATGIIRLLTQYPHPGFLRVQYLPNGDYFLDRRPDVHRHQHDSIARPGDVDPEGAMGSPAIAPSR